MDLPLVADFTLGLSQIQTDKDGITPRRPAPKSNEFYKISLCKHFMQGECPFGDGCHFAHGEHELKRFPKKCEVGHPTYIESTSTRVVVGQRFFVPVVGQLVFVENGRDDDRISNYAFI